MRWNITTADGRLIYDQRLPEYQVISAKLSQELNKADTLTFKIKPDQKTDEIAAVGSAIVGTAVVDEYPHSTEIDRLKTTLLLTCDSVMVSKLRALDQSLDWNNCREYICEGPLAWLNDSIQRPFSFPVDDEHTSPADYFSFLITRHNAQVPASRQFIVGTVTVTDPNNYIARSDTEYSTTFRLLKEGLLDTLGGYIVPRYESNGIYLDYLADFTVLANQPVRFGLNLLTLKTERKGKDVATAILPLGHLDEDTKTRLTISDLPDEETSDICKDGDIVYSKEAEATYGSRITIVEKWDDVTIAANLLTKATAKLAEVRQMPSTVTLTAADLSAAGYSFNTFSLGTYVDVFDSYHAAHGLLARYLVKKLTVDLLNPANNTLTLGATTYSLTENNQRSLERAMTTVQANVKMETAAAIAEVEQRNTSAIEQSEQSILLEVTENYYLKTETDQLLSSLSTTVEQTAAGIRIDFTNFQSDVDDALAGADAKFNALQSYIQMAGGSITLGEVGNAVTLKIENDRIGIYHNGVAITYWTIDDFVAPKAIRIPVGGRLTLGDFAFIPRDNRSLDFTWVGA